MQSRVPYHAHLPATLALACAMLPGAVFISACGSPNQESSVGGDNPSEGNPAEGPAADGATGGQDSNSDKGAADSSGSEGGGGAEAIDESELLAKAIGPATEKQVLACADASAHFAAEVISLDLGPGQHFGLDQMPDIVLGAPNGGGQATGSMDVLSLGDEGQIVLGFIDATIVDGPGADFIVFENAFAYGANLSSIYVEPGQVSASNDGTVWYDFPCATATPFSGCAGLTPVLANGAATNGASPNDPTVAGGDAFDLADVGLSSARFIRITDAGDATTVFDLDAIAIVNAECAP